MTPSIDELDRLIRTCRKTLRETLKDSSEDRKPYRELASDLIKAIDSHDYRAAYRLIYALADQHRREKLSASISLLDAYQTAKQVIESNDSEA